MPRRRERGSRERPLYPLRAYYECADANGDELAQRRVADDELAWIAGADVALEPWLARRQAELVARPHYALRRRGGRALVDGEMQLAYERVTRRRSNDENEAGMFPWSVDADMSVFTHDTHTLAYRGRVLAWWPTSGGGGARTAARGILVLGNVEYGFECFT